MFPGLLGEYEDLVYRGRFDHVIVDLIDAYRTGEGIERFDRYKRMFLALNETGGTIEVEFEALRLAGWLFANNDEPKDVRSRMNLEPIVDDDPHAHIDPTYRNYHLKKLEPHYKNF